MYCVTSYRSELAPPVLHEVCDRSRANGGELVMVSVNRLQPTVLLSDLPELRPWPQTASGPTHERIEATSTVEPGTRHPA